ncbi:hypothetical protein V6R85_24175 [Agrobacterium sp. CCNWLW32]|uniref:hypothetical protein n=1 Tax=Agrobacterium sp. CCNWLW32 TaxID=3122072 RepID=UPI00300FAA56
MYSGPSQPKELLTQSGKPETIQTLDFGYMLVSTNPEDQVLIVGRDGKDGREAIDADFVPGLREFIAPIVKSSLAAGGKMQLFHFEPLDDSREMKIAAWLQMMDARGVHWIRVMPVPLDMPLDRDGQLAYDFEPFEATFASRFAVKH